MSRLIYATRIGCDWPLCEVTATIPRPPRPGQLDPMPEGWAHLYPPVKDTDGNNYADFCPEHASWSVFDLARMLDADRVGLPAELIGSQEKL